jgi:hypothetical protein
MGKKIRRVLGRPRVGQQFYSTSISLTLAERDFLNKQPNPSAFVRSLIDDAMTAQQLLEKGLESELEVIRLNHEIERLRKKRDELWEEWGTFRHNGPLEIGHTMEGLVRDKETGKRVPAVGANAKEKAYLVVLRSYAAQHEKIEAKINELEEKLASMGDKRPQKAAANNL